MTGAAWPPETLETAEEVVLETRGRRTGRPHRVTLWFAHEDGGLWLRTDPDTDWYRNLVAEPRCRVILGQAAADAVREVVPDEERALRHLIDLWRPKYGAEWVADWYVERGRVPVRLRLVPPD
ncbi:MAG TPA: nitroreductase/quinone reductase family protein [Candidatus Limnocylindria bacterium]|nr:nitroreductase/quinone reductase family protein [Candidatus Limnocylindria bacterium]